MQAPELDYIFHYKTYVDQGKNNSVNTNVNMTK